MHRIAWVALVVSVAAGWPATARAYLNPDAGSILLQVLLGGAAGIALAWKLLWRRIAGLLEKPVGKPGTEQ